MSFYFRFRCGSILSEILFMVYVYVVHYILGNFVVYDDVISYVG